MPQIGTGEVAAGVAVTGRIQRAVILGKFLTLDVDLAQRGIECAVTGIAGGQDTVEHIYPGVDTVSNVQRCPHAHQIAGLVHRQQGGSMVEQVIHFSLAFPHGQPANGKAVKIHAAQFLHRAATQILKETALGNAKQ